MSPDGRDQYGVPPGNGAATSWRLKRLETDVVDHEQRLRKIESQQSDWRGRGGVIGGLIVTGIALASLAITAWTAVN